MTTEHAPARPPGAGPEAPPATGVEVPGDASLVPGVSGRAHDAAASAALVASLRDALRGAARVRVVVDGVPDGTASPSCRAVPDLGAQGVDAARVAWRFTGNDDAVRPPRAGVAATVALLALGAAGWAGPVEVHDVPVVRGTRVGREHSTVLVERSC
ncbi:hypothetical protein GCM10025864_41790 [Luteimicrobium album]|uniref:Uncharacterized protein n=1 Tax=Luteimicrobium album TaxID=1054550 RepID=A0ABQ6I7B1_9MICO|nr:hypothetical protein [Luteimicrobium album]GMA26420.1 hypothetical protein GCM10025864_41790 [Luteimicrobium album]